QALGVAQRAYVLKKGEVDYAGPARALAEDEEFVRASYLGETAAPAAKAKDVPAEPIRAASPPSPMLESVVVALPPALVRGLEERAAREGVDPEELVRRVVEGNLEELSNGEANGSKKRKAVSGGRRRGSS
ncbi:MAG: hypothetical protein ACXVQX_09200, partial [Actinomycetota bacterium]